MLKYYIPSPRKKKLQKRYFPPTKINIRLEYVRGNMRVNGVEKKTKEKLKTAFLQQKKKTDSETENKRVTSLLCLVVYKWKRKEETKNEQKRH